MSAHVAWYEPKAVILYPSDFCISYKSGKFGK